MTTGTPAPRRPDASMTLLTSMLERPLDLGYQEASDRRRAAGEPSSTTTRSVIVVVMALLTGFLFALGAQSLRPRTVVTATVKGELVSRIEALQDRSTQQEAAIASLGRQVRDLEALALRQAGAADLTDTISQLEVQAGSVALAGPGVTLTVDDAPSAGGDADAGSRPTGGFESGRVASSDLQIIVNGLWAAGAEAISINGHRLTSTAAIRFAGKAIIVDFRPLTRPYVITALGESKQIQSVFEQSFAGVYMSQLGDQFGIRTNIVPGANLSVPGDSSARLTFARSIRSAIGSSAPAQTRSTGSASPPSTTGDVP